MSRIVYFTLCLLFISHAMAITELSGNFGYDRQVFGDERQNKATSTNYGASVAFYLWGLTAIEFNYYQDHEIISDNVNREIDSTLTVLKQENKVKTTVYGVGLKQAFASRKAFMQPVISLGYAKQYRYSNVKYDLDDAGNVTSTTFEVEDSTTDSMFASFSLRFRVTKTLTLNGSVRTVFKYFETDEARDNVKYLVGFSWFL